MILRDEIAVPLALLVAALVLVAGVLLGTWAAVAVVGATVIVAGRA